VFDHENGIAEIAELLERMQQAVVIARVEADGRLVQDVEDAAKREPICVARRMRWASPPERVAAERSKLR